MPQHDDALPLGLFGKLRAFVAIHLSRVTLIALRLLGRGATALPGKVALRIDPGLLERLTAGRRVILVTGTNGKTTTVSILCSMLREAGHEIITNPSGANLDSGLTTTLVQSYRLLKKSSRLEKPLSIVYEIDEAFFAKLAKSLNPSVCVVTNFFRDQLDRFGELRHTRDLIAAGLGETRAHFVLCADDPLCASLGDDAHETFYFGMSRDSMVREAGGSQESTYCPFCQSPYRYEALAYGHLGRFACTGCDFAWPAADLEFRVEASRPQHLDLTFFSQKQKASSRLPIPGIHNAYNAAAALSAALVCGLPLSEAAASLKKTKAAFGRMERFSVEGKDVCLILVKNPVGMDRGLEFVRRAQDCGGLYFLLNARDPDGRDVSWIWDADFEQGLPSETIGVSGVRRHDLALRLRYAGQSLQHLSVDADAMALFDRMLAACKPGQCLYVLPNYTAMLDLRKELARRYSLNQFWR